MIFELLFLAGCVALALVPVGFAIYPFWADRHKTRGYCCQTCNRWFPRGYRHVCLVAWFGEKS